MHDGATQLGNGGRLRMLLGVELPQIHERVTRVERAVVPAHGGDAFAGVLCGVRLAVGPTLELEDGIAAQHQGIAHALGGQLLGNRAGLETRQEGSDLGRAEPLASFGSCPLVGGGERGVLINRGDAHRKGDAGILQELTARGGCGGEHQSCRRGLGGRDGGGVYCSHALYFKAGSGKFTLTCTLKLAALAMGVQVARERTAIGRAQAAG